MRPRLLEVIGCLTCHGPLALETRDREGEEVMSGELRCPACNLRWPIIRGVPRFLEGIQHEEDLRQVYADSFGHQWTTYDWLREEDAHEFHAITDLRLEDLAGRVVLDAGCGGGRFARVVAPHVKEFFGFDYSIAVDKAFELCRGFGNVHLVQCDVNRHPFKPGVFDFVYSHGVLHHTPDTKRSFDNLPPLVKPGGRLYVALFRKAFLPLRVSDHIWRSALNKLPINVMDKVCGTLAYLYYVPRPIFWKRFFWFSLQKTHEIRKCCLYDWYAPQYHHEHTVEEVLGWFRSAGFSDPRYVNAWPYCPPEIKYAIPTFKDSIRLGQLLGVIGTKAS